MFLKNVTEFLKRFPVALRSLWVAAFFIWAIGGGLNALVIHANDGRMPVPTKAEDFYVIYPAYYRVALEVTPDRMLIARKVPGYTVMTEDSRLTMLADRFYLVTPINIWRTFPSALTIQFIRADIPILGQEMEASIGDILVWIADLLFLVAAIYTTMFVFVQSVTCRLKKHS